MSVVSLEMKKVTLKTSDNKLFKIEEAVAMESITIKSFLEEEDLSNEGMVIPLPNVNAKTLILLIKFCTKEVEFSGQESEEEKKKKFGEEFLKSMCDDDELKEMIMACNYLNIKYLLDLLTTALADRIKNKSVEYVRRLFGVEKDFTAEEEAQLRADNEWAFEDHE